MCTYASFLPPYFPCPFCRVSIFVFLPFSFVTKLKAYTVCARAQASIFTVFWPFSQRNCQIVQDVWPMSEQVAKSKDLRRQSKEWMAVFFNKVCEECYQKSCKYIRNNPTRKKSKTSASQYQSFEHNCMEICDQQRLESLEEKKGGAHFMQAWHQKNLQTLIIPKDDQPANSRDMNTLETI